MDDIDNLIKQRDEEISRVENTLNLNLKIGDMFTKKLFFSIYNIYPKAKLKYKDGLLFIEGTESNVKFNTRCEIHKDKIKLYIEISNAYDKLKELLLQISIEKKLYKTLKKLEEYYLKTD